MEQSRLRFEHYLKRHFGQTSTLKHYHSDLVIFERFVGNKAPETITAVHIDAFIDDQMGRGVQPASINRRLSSLHTFFEYLAGEQPEQHWPNPVIGRRHRLKLGKHLPRDVSEGEVAQLFAVIKDERSQAMFGLMVGAGLRVGEVVGLHLANVEPSPEPSGLTKLRVLGKGNKERIVWLSHSLWETLQRWLAVRPPLSTDCLFVNHHGQPISKAGIQYCLKQYCQVAQVRLSCHRLRHTFARRLVENGLPVDSLARLLGHNQLQTTQRYIDGADPTVRADFKRAMDQLETAFTKPRSLPPAPTKPSPSGPSRQAPVAQLLKLRARLSSLPPWLAEPLDAYLSWHWPTWRGQSAYKLGRNLFTLVQRVWTWLATHRQVDGWQTFRRADLEAWLQARSQEGVSNVTIQGALAQLRSVLKFAETRGAPLDPGVFRVQPPKKGMSLPRYLPEAEYRRLETTILEATQSDTYDARLDRAWFLMLAHTGVRLSELLDCRLADLNLATRVAIVRGAKADRDRAVYLTPTLGQALSRYLLVRPDLPMDDHVFLFHNRVPSTQTIQKRLASYGQQVGVTVTPHQLRHTLATRLINQGMPIASLRRLLGHQNLNTTQLYAHIYDETLYQQFQAAMSSLEAIPVEGWPSVAIPQPHAVALNHSK